MLRALPRELPVMILVLMLAVMMVVPLPWQLLDLLITLNLSLSLVVLLVALSTQRPLDFSLFPSLLLLTTLFRLSLNVSSTRLILLNGFAGDVIQGFGQFVVGGSPLVGFIVFVILVIIQFVVITRGSERVAEVAARFTLDAMPGKQMAIDADLNSGLIGEAEARRRRLEIQQEADFFGAMDGATKFVRGDAIAGIAILVVNIIGGLIIGVAIHHLPFTQALSTYTLLTVGDGLVSQIPALLLSTATGLLVTRSSSGGVLASGLAREVFGDPRALKVAAGALLVLGVIPGLPFWSFAGLALLFFLLGRARDTTHKREESERQRVQAEKERESARRPEAVLPLTSVDPLEVELGYGLVPLADSERGGDLLERVVLLRRQMATELGLVLAPIRVRDNLELGPEVYSVKLHGVSIARGELKLGHLLAMSATPTADLPGIPTKEPVFGLDAMWIPLQMRSRAEALGYTVVDAPSVIATHLAELVRQHASELLSRQEVSRMVEAMRKDHPAVVEEVLSHLSVGQIQRVLQELLAERIPIRDLSLILEHLADAARSSQEAEHLVTQTRLGLKRSIAGVLGLTPAIPAKVLTLAPEWEDRLQSEVMTGDLAQNLSQGVGRELPSLLRGGTEPILLCNANVRSAVHRLLERSYPKLHVVAYQELTGYDVEAVGVIR